MLRKVTLYIADAAQFSNGLAFLNDDEDVNGDRFLNLLNPGDDLNGDDLLNFLNADVDVTARVKTATMAKSFAKDIISRFE